MCVSVPQDGQERTAKLVSGSLELSPCHNGGTSVNQVGGYVCQYPPGWAGKDCKVGECSP